MGIPPTFLLLLLLSHGGDASTLATLSFPPTLCGLLSSSRTIQCFNATSTFPLPPSLPSSSLSSGPSLLCSLLPPGSTLLCFLPPDLLPRRLYSNPNLPLSLLSVGHRHLCALLSHSLHALCWRGPSPPPDSTFSSLSSGLDFSCGLLTPSNSVLCWGTDHALATQIQWQFRNVSLSRLVAGARHVCGFLSHNGTLICKGSNVNKQLDSPIGELFGDIALGDDFTCGVRRSNRSVVCWGGGGRYEIDSRSFEAITAGSGFVCGLGSADFKVVCWGPRWPLQGLVELPVSTMLPGECVGSSCECGVYPESERLCSGSGWICSVCDQSELSSNNNVSLSTNSSMPLMGSGYLYSSKTKNTPIRKDLLGFVVVGSVGGLAGICSVVYCLYMGGCCGRRKVHNSVLPRITRIGSNGGRGSSNSPPSRPLAIRRQCSRVMRRQRSGTSSTKHRDRAEEFAFSELAAATEEFAFGNKIGAGSFGVVYRGKLSDGRDVAIKRGEMSLKAKRFQEKESAFESELSFLSRLHHKHLVRLVGFCQERDERLLVYEYMKNGALYDHLHDKRNVEKGCSVVNSWKVRIRVALDAARGIEYLHNYAVPPIIHRDIKSSNILLDGNWTARVSDFGLSLMGPEGNRNFRPSKAAGTVGYIDPEYYGLNVLTAKSDVYGLGVVLLELLTGKRAIFKAEELGGAPMSVVDYAVPEIMGGELVRILDRRVGSPAINESEAVELVAYTAMHCVNLEGKDRPTMSDIVANLERALALCDESHGSISSASISVGSG